MKNKSIKAYYHISPIENKDNILLEGLKSESKQIFVSDCEEQLIMIAHKQIFTTEYSVFKILPSGINGRIAPDNVAEMGSSHQFIIKQNSINPEHIIHLRDEKWNYWDLAEYTNGKLFSAIGLDVEKQLEEMISQSKEWCLHYNTKYGKDIQFNNIMYSGMPAKFNSITNSIVPTYKGLPTVHLKRGNSNREPNDFYPTPPYVTEELLKRENFTGTIWESACGDGAISDVLLKNGYVVHSTDLINRGYGSQLDFLKSNAKMADNIVTNPPYKYALEFILQAKKSSSRKIAMLLPITFLESQKRYNMFKDTEFPLKTVYQFSRRVSLYKGGVKMKNSGTTAYAWYVWDKDYRGEPTIKWIR